MKTHVHLYLASSWNEMFHVKVVDKIKTHFMFINFFPKIVPFVR
jgi:hypothetical protein